ncbi:MAG: acetyl-CoA carboxylase biotin carboxyl carrier protein subunit [Planctomycetota bacterium]
MKLCIAGKIVSIEKSAYPFANLKIDNRSVKIKIIDIDKNSCEYLIKKRKVKFYWLQLDDTLFQILSEGESFVCEVRYVLPTKAQDKQSEKSIIYEIKAPVSGLITKIFVGPASIVNRGQKLLSLEAMKMENEIQAPVSGKVVQINVMENREVNKNETLIVLEQNP